MKYLAAYTLLTLAGKEEPTEKDITTLLKDAGSKAEKECIDRLLAALKGQKLHNLVNEGSKKLVSGGAAVSAGGPAPAGGAGGQPEAKKEAKKEEKVEEEEANVDMGGLFGDEDY